MMDLDRVRINHKIKAKRVLLKENDAKLGVFDLSEALSIAENRGLDLVEINSKTETPICILIEFGKYKYEQKKKQNEISKKTKTIKLKEIQLHSNTDSQDLNTKLNHITEFLQEGHKVKVSIRFRGGEIRHTNLGRDKLNFVSDSLKSISKIECFPNLEGKHMNMVLAPL